MIWNTAVLLIVLWLDRRFKKDGLVFLSYLSLYSLGRFVLTFVRQENQFFWGLQEAQIVALLVVVASVAVMVYLITKQQIPARQLQQ